MPTITLVNNRSVSGSHTYGPFLVPAGLQGLVTISTNVNSAHMIDPTKSIRFDVDSSIDSGVTWKYVGGFFQPGDPTWYSQLNPNTGVADLGPYIQFNLAELAGKQVRARVVIPQAITLTAQVLY